MNSSLPYEELPPPPEKLNAANTMVRMLDGLGFRYNCDTDGLTDMDANFQPGNDSWSMIELMTHILELMENMSEAFPIQSKGSSDSLSILRGNTLAIIYDMSCALKDMPDEVLCSIIMHPYKSQPELNYNFWYMINGQIADALAHVGQIGLYRKLLGNPEISYSPLRGMKELYKQK